MIEKTKLKLKQKAEIIAEKERKLSTVMIGGGIGKMKKLNHDEDDDDFPIKKKNKYIEEPIISNQQFEEFQKRELSLRKKQRELAIEQQITEENKLRLDASIFNFCHVEFYFYCKRYPFSIYIYRFLKNMQQIFKKCCNTFLIS